LNNQTWNFPNKPQPNCLYKTKIENLEQRKMKKILCRDNNKLYVDEIIASDNWTVEEETTSQPAGGKQEEEYDYETDDCVIV